MNEAAYLAFVMGLSLTTYDARFLRSRHHVIETIDFHIRRLGLTPTHEARAEVIEITCKHFE